MNAADKKFIDALTEATTHIQQLREGVEFLEAENDLFAQRLAWVRNRIGKMHNADSHQLSALIREVDAELKTPLGIIDSEMGIVIPGTYAPAD